jgi:acyl-CoA reductase-like NAD-dependent aldehyde dehydrogenase
MSIKVHPMLINGQKVSMDNTIDVVNPRTGAVFAKVPEADTTTMQSALDSADQGFKVWSAKTPAERKAIILRYADLLDENSERLIELLMTETGKPRDNAEYDFGMLPTCLRFFVEEFERLDQPVLHDPDGRFLHYIQRQPLGVAVGFLAWNFPLLNIGYKLGPVLASGCSAIIKPSTQTPVASLECVYLLKEAGVPDGVVNVFTSSDHEISKTLLQSDIPKMATMIGSTRGGLEIMRAACTSIKHFSVELGGNAPVVVYPDANIRKAATQIVDLKFANCGQICVSPNRCFVHASVYDEFMQYARERAAETTMGPMTSDKARQFVLGLVKSAVADGAELVCGGQAVEGKGFFMEPTILRNVRQDMAVAKEEIFGPVLPVIPYTDEDDEIAMANDTIYGLAAYVFTTSLSRGLRAARDIQAGSVCVNEVHYSVQLPHGGLKQSGIGKDCSRYSLLEYLTLKRVSILIEE